MHGNDHVDASVRWFHGPLVWLVSAGSGLLAGWLVAGAMPGTIDGGHAVIPPWLVAPFAILLASIALMPFVSERIWHRHFPDFSFALGGFVAAYMLRAFGQADPAGHGTVGGHAVMHAAIEYYSFVALVCGLYVVSGGILINFRGRATPLFNTGVLAFGAIFANLVGTTGASMLLLRPFMRANEGRLRPLHIVLFIMIVSNCGGLLTPIGDPPLYLGFLKGVPFTWTLSHLWPEWAMVVGSLLAIFFVVDTRVGPAAGAATVDQRRGVSVSGRTGIICMGLMIVGVFIDPVLKSRYGIEGFPWGATFQFAVALASYLLADKKIFEANQFSFFPVKEVSLLFLGIFLTMIPALGYLSVNGQKLGVDSPGAFYFVTGALSAVLDNAPTYVNFLQIAIGPVDINQATIGGLLQEETGRRTLAAISSGAVFFGAMTYIGNGPNFMVRTIASGAGVRMPGFFGYLLLAAGILLPVLVVNWAIFIR